MAHPVVTVHGGRVAGHRLAGVRVITTLIRCRAIVAALLARDLSARYRGSVLGFLWTFLNPILLMAVYSLVFRFYIRLDVPNYPLFLLCGLLPWLWFSGSVIDGTNSILGGGSLVTKSLFPAEILPTVTVLNGMVNYLLSVPLLLVVAWLYGVTPNPVLWLALPLILALQLVFTLGVVLATSALNVPYRDVQHILGNVILIWFFVSPILYPLTQIPDAMRAVVAINPSSLLVVAYRNVFFDLRWPDPVDLGLLAAWAIVSVVVGARIFDAHRDTFSELV